MKLIIIADDTGRKYTYNLYTTFEYEDDTLSPDTRVIMDDDLEVFIAELRNFLKR